MAIFNEILAPRYARALQKLFGVKGPVPTRQLAGEIAPVHPIFNGRENRFLEGWSLFGVRPTTNAVAAQNSAVRLDNPKTSKTIVVVESLKIILSTAGEAVLELAFPALGALATPFTPVFFDVRGNPPQNGTNSSQCSSSSGNNATAPGSFVFDDIQLTAGNFTSPENIVSSDQEIILAPNSTLQVRSITLNIAMTVAIRWRERSLEDSELTG